MGDVLKELDMVSNVYCVDGVFARAGDGSA